MKCEVVRAEEKKDICVNDMEPGDIGMITMWSVGAYVGKIVGRSKEGHLFEIGGEGLSWDRVFRDRDENYQVELLRSGDSIVIKGD